MFCRCINNKCAQGYFSIGSIYQWHWANGDESLAHVLLTMPDVYSPNATQALSREEFLRCFKIFDNRKEATDYRIVLTCTCKKNIYEWLPNFIFGRIYQCQVSADHDNVLVFPDIETNIPISLSANDFLKNFDLYERCPDDEYGD